MAKLPCLPKHSGKPGDENTKGGATSVESFHTFFYVSLSHNKIQLNNNYYYCHIYIALTGCKLTNKITFSTNPVTGKKNGNQ